MIRCSNCRTEIDNIQERVCPKCGESLYVEEDNTQIQDERCECGLLVCKLRRAASGGFISIEIKCRRCKRVHVIPVAELGR